MKNTQISTPRILKTMCATAARTASRGLPSAASSAVTQVPMFAPKASAMPAGREMRPSLAITMARPVVADEDWTSPVKIAPTRMPSSGSRSFSMSPMNGS